MKRDNIARKHADACAGQQAAQRSACRPIIIDTDPGIDDAAAIVIAIRNKKLNVRLLSTVAANVGVEKTTKNALKLVEFLDSDIPVARGCSRPLLRELHSCPDVHGESGMDGYDFPDPVTKPLSIHSVEAMREIIFGSPEPVTLVAIGAQTNLAILFRMYPEIRGRIREIVMMGGAIRGGNRTSLAEFNIYVDPHAASIVFQSGVPIRMLGLDVTEKAVLHAESVRKIRESGPDGSMLCDLFSHYRDNCMENGLPIHDACAIAYLLRPEMFVTQEMYVEIVTDGPAVGAMVTDTALMPQKGNKPNVTVCVDVDAAAFEDWFVKEFEV